MKGKKGKTVLNTFFEIANESNRKPKKLWVDQGRKFYNKLIQKWLGNDDSLMYFTNNEGKSVIAEKIVKSLKANIYKRMTANDSKSDLSYLNKLVDQYNNPCHHSINKNPINAYYYALSREIETNHKAHKFKVNCRFRVTNHKNVFSKGFTENCSEEIFAINSALKTNP